MDGWYHATTPELRDHAAVLDVVVQQQLHLLLRDEPEPVASWVEHDHACVSRKDVAIGPPDQRSRVQTTHSLLCASEEGRTSVLVTSQVRAATDHDLVLTEASRAQQSVEGIHNDRTLKPAEQMRRRR
jgi:hypothetical protein